MKLLKYNFEYCGKIDAKIYRRIDNSKQLLIDCDSKNNFLMIMIDLII
jgi:hypothetical protein